MRRFWDRETARRALAYEAERLGRTPRDKDLRSPVRTCASLSTYRKIFGSLGAAHLAAGLDADPRIGSTGWRKLKCKRGHDRTPENVDTQGHCRLCAAYWHARQGRGPMMPRGWTPERAAAEMARRSREITDAKRRYWQGAA